MPSPGKMTICFVMVLLVPVSSFGEQPRRFLPVSRLVSANLVHVLQRQPDIVEAVQQAVLAKRVDLKLAHGARWRRHRLRAKVHGQPVTRRRFRLAKQAIHRVALQHDRQQAILEAVVVEDIGVARCDDNPEPVIHERPRGMFARGTATEVVAREQDLRALVARLVEHEIRIDAALAVIHARLARIEITRVIEQTRPETGALDRLQILLGNDRVGVDIGTVQRHDQSVQLFEFLHQCISRTSTKCPAIAAAAAIAGLTRCERPPAPWRPSKLRFDVEAQRSPGSSRSAFMARHIEHPGSRHSKPACVNILSRPSFSACAFTRPEPGTTMASLMLAATFLPLTTAAAARRSSMRELVQEPMKILSSGIARIGVPGLRSMYLSACCMLPRLTESASWSGSGTAPSTGTTISGDVPHVTCGFMAAAISAKIGRAHV